MADAVDHAGQGSICLWRLAAHVASPARIASVRRRVYRFFQFVHLDSASAARIVADLLSLDGKRWVLAIDRYPLGFRPRPPSTS